MAWRLWVVILILFGVSWNDALAQAPVELTIFVDEDSLTVYVPEQGYVSMQDLTFQTTIGTTIYNRALDSYPAVLGLPFNALPTPICFRLLRDTSTRVALLECQQSTLLTQPLSASDIFWYERSSGFRTVLVMQAGLAQEICPAGQSRCEMMYNSPTFTPTPAITNTPTPTLTPTPLSPLELARQGVTRNADWTPYFETFDGVEMALVPSGCFDMGDRDVSYIGDGGRQCFDKPFWIDRYEVTNAQYKRCVDAGECTLPDDITYYTDVAFADHPVVYVDWFQASTYAEWRNGRLPTEAEWEYAARGPNALIYPWGNDFDRTQLNFCDVNCTTNWSNANYDDGYEGTAPVGTYAAGASWVGALDLSGNVWEWTSTLPDDYPYQANDGRENQDGIYDRRMRRGGSWYDFLVSARSASRFRDLP